MSKIIIEIDNDQDAQRALNVLAAYLGSTNEQPDTVAEEPKKEVAKKTTPRKTTKKKVEESESDEVNETEADDGVDLKTLTGIAKDAVAKTDRATVKETIGEFGEKLSAVDKADYAALAEKLKAL